MLVMCAPPTHILVLNYNGRALLEECLPSVLDASRQAGMPCGVTVIDNDSLPDSLDGCADRWPEVCWEHEPNRGLASFNVALARRTEDVVLLLNNDVKLAAGSVAPLVEAVRAHPDALFSAPQCWTFDGSLYEGMSTRVRMRYGLVQGLCRVPGHESRVNVPGLTASAGPVLAVDRRRFLELGGYDPLFFPGRIEDLDLGFRGWMAGLRGYYVPESLAYHQGFATFGTVLGASECDRLALRNTLLFCWKNLTGRRLYNHLAWLPIRLLYWLGTARGAGSALVEALGLLDAVRDARRRQQVGQYDWQQRQDEFFQQFAF